MYFDSDRFSFAATADGHGSLCYFRSDFGSEYAVDSAFECVSKFLENLGEANADIFNEDERDQLFLQLWKSIVSRWHSMVDKNYAEEPFTEAELDSIPEQFAYYRDRYESGKYIDAYGTTLAFAVVTEDFGFCMQIGDGSCVVLDEECNACEPIPEDPRCHDNITTSLCQDDAAYSYRAVFFSKDDIPPVIFLGTDGVENSYCSFDMLVGFYRGLALTFCEYGMDEGVRQLSSFLPEMTRKGSGDDVSCAGIVNTERLKKMEPVLRELLMPEPEVAAEETAEDAEPVSDEAEPAEENITEE